MIYKGEIVYVSGIYSIRNLVNNKVYVGSTVNLYSRFATHRYNLISKTHTNKHLQSSYNIHKNFEFEILEKCSKDDLEERETYWINFFNSSNKDFGYNMRIVASSNKGYTHSQEAKDKISKSTKGVPKKPLSKEHKESIGNAFRGKKLTISHKQAISDNHSRHNLGKSLSDEHRKRLSEVNTNKIVSKETLEKMSNSMKGKNSKFTEEDIKQIKTMLKEGYKNKDIAKMYDVNPVTISDIKRGVVWKHVII